MHVLAITHSGIKKYIYIAILWNLLYSTINLRGFCMNRTNIELG